jgi:hypothetical protein
MNVAIISLIIILVILIVYYIYQKQLFAYNEQFIEGMWYADEGFCDDCDVEQYKLAIGSIVDEESSFNTIVRNAYLLITPDIENTVIKLSYRPPWICSSGSYKIYADVSSTDTLPEKIILEVNTITGNMKIYDETVDESQIESDGKVKKNLYANLYKNNEVTNLSKE